MADYKAAKVVGSTWQRTNQIIITNPLGGLPAVIYNEEQVINTGDGKFITSPQGNFSVPCADMGEIITLLDPATGEPTGETMLVGILYQAIYSHYIAKAFARDNTKLEEQNEI